MAERLIGVEIWEGDGRRKTQCSQSSGSLDGPDLFTELPSLRNSMFTVRRFTGWP